MLVSCLMATHNRRRFVPEAVACFAAQALTDSELLVVDDGESVLDLVPVGPRYHYVQTFGKQHFCALRDVGQRLSRSKYVAVWDDDDLSHPERLAVQVAALEETGAGLCLLGSSVVTRGEESWVYTPTSNPWALDNSAVVRREPGFTWHVDDTCYSALRALKGRYAGNVVVVPGRPDLLTTRRHAGNTCSRPVGQGPEWTTLA